MFLHHINVLAASRSRVPHNSWKIVQKLKIKMKFSFETKMNSDFFKNKKLFHKKEKSQCVFKVFGSVYVCWWYKFENTTMKRFSLKTSYIWLKHCTNIYNCLRGCDCEIPLRIFLFNFFFLFDNWKAKNHRNFYVCLMWSLCALQYHSCMKNLMWIEYKWLYL